MRRANLSLAFEAFKATAVLAGMTGCAYRLQLPEPPSEIRVHIIAPAPQEYRATIETGSNAELKVPADGRLTIDIPGHGRACRVYLFNKIRIGREADPLSEWHLILSRNGERVETLSLRKLGQLKRDQEGYFLLDALENRTGSR